MFVGLILLVLVGVILALNFGAWKRINKLKELAKLTYKHLRRVVIFVVGTSTVLAGIVMIILPGPAILVIPAGLAILALEFVWARVLLAKFKNKAKVITNNVQQLFEKK